MKALVLLSGGLDSTLAVKLILDQGIDVVAINFISPFQISERKWVDEISKKFKIPLKAVKLPWGSIRRRTRTPCTALLRCEAHLWGS